MNRTKYLLTADDVKDYLECSRDHAYKVIKKLNLELASMGYEVEAGKVPRKFFAEKFYGFEASLKGGRLWLVKTKQREHGLPSGTR